VGSILALGVSGRRSIVAATRVNLVKRAISIAAWPLHCGLDIPYVARSNLPGKGATKLV